MVLGRGRSLLARTHPDAGGDGDLFIWTENLRQRVVGGRMPQPHPEPRREARVPRRRQPPTEHTSRVPYPPNVNFTTLTRAAVEVVAGEVGEPFSGLLKMLSDCEPTIEQTGHLRGASYKQLAYTTHLSSMTKDHRREWYRIAEGVPLSELHVGHIIAKLTEGRTL